MRSDQPSKVIVESVTDESIAIEVKDLSKVFKLYNRPSDMIREFITGSSYHSEYKALQNISFTLKHGEVVGVLGRNGAGKSTLLKIIAGVLDYDDGSYSVNGRVAALLELGSGFSPEYTGRDNIVFGGMCLGMKKEEILAKVDSIIEFSELEDVIDQPFKTYSTGVKARLTFATAISVEAEILIIDEALSVGDALFSEKCFKRIKEIAASGVTIFFVTHSLGQVYELCNRALLLDTGKLVCDGLPRFVGHEYEALLARDRSKKAGKNLQQTVLSRGNLDASATKNIDAYVKQIALTDEEGDVVTTMHYGETYGVFLQIHYNKDIPRAGVSFRLETPSGLVVFGDATSLQGINIVGKEGEVKNYVFKFRNVLAPGQYLIGGGVVEVFDDSFNILHVIRGDALLAAVGPPVNGLVNLECEFEHLMDLNKI